MTLRRARLFRFCQNKSTFDNNPIIAPAWELSGDDNYAIAPGHIVVGDVKMLNKEQTRKLEGIRKQVRPLWTEQIASKSNPAAKNLPT